MHPLFRDMIYENHWLWAHIVLGGLIAKILLNWFAPNLIIGIILLIAIVYEIYQWISGEHRNFLDAVGDIFGALIMATIIVF